MTRNSIKRKTILDTVIENRIHGTAEQIYELVQKEDSRISLATVYRNLQQFSDNGEITKITGFDDFDRFDGNTKPHAHFYCTICKTVYDIMIDPMSNPDEIMPAGFVVKSVQLSFKGTCSKCSEILK